ncbi:secreted protein containing Peptidase S9B, dipeptidylpeptidase IV, partial [mine drainage metagenome]
NVRRGITSLLLSSRQLAGAAAPAWTIKNQIKRDRITRYGVKSYRWSPKSDAILFLSDDQIYLYSLLSRKITQVTHQAGSKRNPQLAPDGRWVSYLTHGTLHYAAVRGGPIHRVAAPRKDILNGELDWVYTEELGLRSAYAWSPDSRYIAFLQFDDARFEPFPSSIICWVNRTSTSRSTRRPALRTRSYGWECSISPPAGSSGWRWPARLTPIWRASAGYPAARASTARY